MASALRVMEVLSGANQLDCQAAGMCWNIVAFDILSIIASHRVEFVRREHA
jgi:hypothetical protein